MKTLRDIVSSTPDQKKSAPDVNSSTLKGIKKSKVVDGSTGKDSGVDYKAKAPDDDKFVAVHKTEDHEDRVGNGDDVYKASKIKYSMDDPRMNKFGRKNGKDKDVYEGASCNHSKLGKSCPVHGIKKCPAPSGDVPNTTQTFRSDTPYSI